MGYTCGILVSTMHDRALNNERLLDELTRTSLPVVIVNQKPGLLNVEQTEVRNAWTIVHSPLSGISNSRNEAIRHAHFDFGILCDDDIELMVENIEALAFELAQSKPQPEILIHPLMRDATTPWQKKKFPAGRTIRQSQWLKWRNLQHVNSMEIVLNLTFLKSQGIGFNPQFGLGSAHTTGGEEIELLSRIIRAGGRALFHPLPLRIHREISSGKSISAQNAFNMGRVHGATISPVWHEALIARHFVKYRFKPDGSELFKGYVRGLKLKNPEMP